MMFIYLLWAGLLFFLPGFLLHRRWPSALPPLTIYATSAGLWFLAWQLMNLAGVPFSRVGLSGVGLVLAGGAAWVSRSRTSQPRIVRFRWWVRPQGVEWVWFAAMGCGATSLVIRSLVDPLSGWDNKLRWEHLALEWIRGGDLAGYPPRTPADFEHYAWVDGMPPLVAGLNAYLYAMLGSAAKGWTALRVIGEMALAGYGIGALAKSLWGPRALWPALGIAGSSALLGWSIANGQEIGQLVLAFSGAAAWFTISPRHPRPTAYLGVGFVVALAAAAREYGGALLLLGVIHLIRQQPINWRSLRVFILPTALVLGPWYLRNLALTGNPLYPLSPGGLLPTPDFYTALNDSIRDVWGWDGTLFDSSFIAAVVLVLAGVAIVFGVLGFPRIWRSQRGWLIGWIAAIVALWAWSVPYTAGGGYYSLRVLAPAVALSAAAGGWVGGGARPRVVAVCAVLTLGVALDGARRAWFLPNGGLVSPWSFSMAFWTSAARSEARLAEQSHFDELMELAAGSIIAVDKVELWAALRKRGARVVFLRNPATRDVYAVEQNAADILASLKAADIEVILVSIDQAPALRDASKSKFLVDLIHHNEPDLQWGGVFVFKLSQLRPVVRPET